MFENMLPIGSVVLLKNAKRKTMIIGFKQVGEKEPDKIYDYAGVVYPLGSIGVTSQFLFNADQISDVIYKGYENPEWNDFVAALEKETETNPEFEESIRTGKVLFKANNDDSKNRE